MAIAVSAVSTDTPKIKSKTAKITFDSSYPTGGEALTVGDLGFTVVLGLQAIQNSGGYVYQYDAAAKKILVYYGDNNNAADGPLIEVANASDLSAIAPTFLVFGYVV
jgi:hypothetical protein